MYGVHAGGDEEGLPGFCGEAFGYGKTACHGCIVVGVAIVVIVCETGWLLRLRKCNDDWLTNGLLTLRKVRRSTPKRNTENTARKDGLWDSAWHWKKIAYAGIVFEGFRHLV